MDTWRFVLSAAALVSIAHGVEVYGAGDASRGAKVFQACAACHSLEAGQNMTGPSLHGVWGRKAGTLQDFIRYSDALKQSGVVWTEDSLDKWLTNPASFIPGNQMTFAGINSVKARRDLIAYLELASKGKAPAAAAGTQGGGMMGGQAQRTNLKQVEPAYRVSAIRYCKDSYFVSTQDGKTHSFWEANLRFKSDSSQIGPPRGHPVILPAGMMGDRASVFFSDPEEISSFIKKQC